MHDEHAVWDATRRIRLLSRLEPVDSRPWEQVARVLRDNGDPSGAEEVLIAYRRHQRRTHTASRRHRWRRLLDVLEDLSVGYGYRPQRALFFLVALVMAVTVSLAPAEWRAPMRTTDAAGIVYTPTGALTPATTTASSTTSRCGAGKVRCLNPVLYAVDTVIPIIDLKQRSSWYPTSDAGGRWLDWWLNTCTILGWLISTVLVLSLTRFGRSSPD
jgi:hypothetical protein